MKIEIGPSPLGPVRVEVPDGCELHKQLNRLFTRPTWLTRQPPGIVRAHDAELSPADIRWLEGAVGE